MVKFAGIAAVAIVAAVGTAVILLVAGIWYDWPVADWIWNMLP